MTGLRNLLALVVVLVLASAAAWGATDRLNLDPPPDLQPPSDVEERLVFESVGVVLDEPATEAIVDAKTASESAWPEAQIAGHPTGQRLLLGSLTSAPVESQRGALVWLVAYAGACVPAFGPLSVEERGCIGSECFVMVDARTGKYLASFASTYPEQLLP
jgi:hypothetical protein